VLQPFLWPEILNTTALSGIQILRVEDGYPNPPCLGDSPTLTTHRFVRVFYESVPHVRQTYEVSGSLQHNIRKWLTWKHLCRLNFPFDKGGMPEEPFKSEGVKRSYQDRNGSQCRQRGHIWSRKVGQNIYVVQCQIRNDRKWGMFSEATM